MKQPLIIKKAIGQIVINDGLGTIANVISEVAEHPWLGLDGRQKRWVVSTYEYSPRIPGKPPLKPVHCRVNDSQILRWIVGPDIEEKDPKEPKYNWNLLLNGEIWQLTQDDDFVCKTDTFKVLARKHAKKQGKGLNIQIDGDVITLQGVINVGDKK